ncbi:transposase [Streptomyces sp. NPDC002057]|uniref:transposase n=1 Tax=Streptomyces sp. NPDC002057 TaxID=3154664 RepID=UPI0033170396
MSGIEEGPWPHLRVDHGPGGALRDLRWAIAPAVTLEVLGDPGGWPSKAELRRILLRCAQAAQELVEAPHVPGRPVISGIRPSGLLIWAPLVTGQPRWLLVWDNLNVHKAAGLREWAAARDWLTLHYLPPYAPDLNPVEGIWSLLRRGWLSNVAFSTTEHLIQRIRRGLRHIQYRSHLIDGCLAETG